MNTAMRAKGLLLDLQQMLRLNTPPPGTRIQEVEATFICRRT
jgi:hypothetical protein